MISKKKNTKLCIKEKGNLLFIFDIFHIRHLKLRNFTLHSVLICYYLLFILEIKFEYNLVLESILSEYLWSFIRCWKKIAHVKYTLNILQKIKHKLKIYVCILFGYYHNSTVFSVLMQWVCFPKILHFYLQSQYLRPFVTEGYSDNSHPYFPLILFLIILQKCFFDIYRKLCKFQLLR